MTLDDSKQSLVDESQTFRELIANAPVAMAMFDRDMRYIIHSNRWLIDYGLIGQGIIGKSHYEVFPDIPERWKQLHRDALDGKAQSCDEDEFERETGGSIFLKWALQPWKNIDGEIGGIVMVTDNITGLVMSRKNAISASKAKTDFLATISHEIRTPMNGILGLADYLLESEMKEDQRKTIETIFNSTKTLLTIVNDVLDLSAAEAGKIRFEEKVFKPAECMGSIYSLLNMEAEKKGIGLEMIPSPEMPKYMYGDEGRYRQIVLNLAGNAIKFTNEGKVTIRCDVINGDKIRLAVIDTGYGMTRKQVRSVFESFKQYTHSKDYQEGSGLGLTITKNLVEAMNGSIRIASKKGIGTIVFVRFPIKPIPPDLLKEKENEEDSTKGYSSGRYYTVKTKQLNQADIDLRGLKVMLVEDNKINQMVIEKILEKSNVNLSIFSCGEDVIKHCESAKTKEEIPDVILMDLQLPDIDGYQVTRRIRMLTNPWPKIPIIALTAAAFDAYRDQAIDAGMTDFLAKPIEKGILRDKLAEYIKT